MKILEWIKNAVIKTLSWYGFAILLVYVGTRVSNFLDDPYMQSGGEGLVRDMWFEISISAVLFIVLYNAIMSTYRIFIKKEYSNWKHWIVFVLNMGIICYGVFS